MDVPHEEEKSRSGLWPQPVTLSLPLRPFMAAFAFNSWNPEKRSLAEHAEFAERKRKMEAQIREEERFLTLGFTYGS